jgi:hypothetical protein
MQMKNAAVVAVAILLALALMHFAKPRPGTGSEVYEFATTETRYTPGDLDSIRDKHGYGVVKVLVVDPDVVHIRLYKNTFPERPSQIDPSRLSVGTIDDPDGFGMGHLPISRNEFQSWHPVLIMQSKVTPDELEGYEEWKKDQGGVFGK